MSVKVNLHPYLTEGTEAPQVELEGKNVGECLKGLVARFPAMQTKLFAKPDKLHGYIEVLVNAQTTSYSSQAADTNSPSSAYLRCPSACSYSTYRQVRLRSPGIGSPRHTSRIRISIRRRDLLLLIHSALAPQILHSVFFFICIERNCISLPLI
jgi:molybdopterin converting factor small subunit